MNIPSINDQKIKSIFAQADVCKDVEYVGKELIESLRVVQDSQVKINYTLSINKQQVYVFVEQGAQLQFYLSDHKALTEYLQIDLIVVLQKDAQANLYVSIIESLNIACTLSLYMEGDRSTARIYGLYALNGKQKVSIQTYQSHQGADTKSDLVIKGLIKDQSQVLYKGLIKIDKDAYRTDASQENKTIVLSEKAKVVSIPSIEVLQQDVQCCHGSAIGKFDKEHLWYLQSKGLSYQDAYTLLIRSFCNDVVGSSVEESKKTMESVCKKFI